MTFMNTLAATEATFSARARSARRPCSAKATPRHPREPAAGIPTLPGSAPSGRPTPVLHLHATSYCYAGDANPPRQAG
jgi:hypothetical protein